MVEYIDRKALIKAVEDLPNCYNGFSDTYDKACIIGLIEELPSADVVERRKGKWEDNTKDGGWKCSECGFISYSVGFYKRYKTKYRMRFCPNCGTDMRRKADD